MAKQKQINMKRHGPVRQLSQQKKKNIRLIFFFSGGSVWPSAEIVNNVNLVQWNSRQFNSCQSLISALHSTFIPFLFCLAFPVSPKQRQTPSGPLEICRGSCWGEVWLHVCWRMSDCKVCTGTQSLCHPLVWSRLTAGCRMSFCLWSPLRQPAAPVGAQMTVWTGPSCWSPGETPGG